MSVVRGLRLLLLVVLSLLLLAWVGRVLFGVDQRGLFLPFLSVLSIDASVDGLVLPLLIGLGWACLLAFGGTSWDSTSKTVTGPVAMATVIESDTTGLSVNDVPQYQVYLEVKPTDGGRYVSQCRLLASSRDAWMVEPGVAVPVHYDLNDPDFVTPAEHGEPEVRRAVLRWRIERGLVEPRLIRALVDGRSEHASVIELRPTGRHQDGQSELQVRLLVSPDGQDPFETTSRVFVYPEAVSELQVGSPVRAYWMPGDRENVAVAVGRGIGR